MSWITIASGAGVVLAAVAAVVIIARPLLDHACDRCGRRDWAKGVAPWRCRTCGALWTPPVRRSRRTAA